MVLLLLIAAETAQLGRGGVAQLGERLNGIQEVSGSIPLASMAWQSSGLYVGRLVEVLVGRVPR